MRRLILDTGTIKRWCHLAVDALYRYRDDIDVLNIFPVPDFDTGTNLHLTMQAAADSIDRLPVTTDLAVMWRALVQGALISARGNSGVILSAILRGTGEVLSQGGGLACALQRASELADRAVSHPVNGTMLSVLRAAADSCPDTGEPAAITRLVSERARIALSQTTSQLDVLARNRLVDAGAMGLCVILDALASAAGEYSVEPTCRTTCEPPHLTHFTKTISAYEGPKPDQDRTGHGLTKQDHGSFEVVYLLDADKIRCPGCMPNSP